jgi:flagellin
MGFRITTNVASINAQRSFSASQREINKSFAQLSSGNRITKSADDAAGLGISEGLKAQIRGYGQAKRNAADAVSLTQVSEGGLGEVSNILTRLRELGVQAASDTVGDRERGFIDKEVQQLKAEMQRIADSTRFGNTKLLDGSGGVFDFQVDINNNAQNDRISFDSSTQNVTLDALGVSGLDYNTKEGAQTALETIDMAQVQVNSNRATLGAIQNRLFSTQEYIGIAEENLSAANSRIRDTDIAQSTAELARNNILMQATTGVLSQANAIPSMALKLIG